MSLLMSMYKCTPDRMHIWIEKSGLVVVRLSSFVWVTGLEPKIMLRSYFP